MSYGRLQHDNRSSLALNGRGMDSSPQTAPDSHLDDDLDSYFSEAESLSENFELKEFSHTADSTLEPDFEDWGSDEEKDAEFSLRSRRASASTVQSFMLYTPDEERSVIRKFDRRLVLFVALLYMLSFLDRSSR